jgi:hypothetical protein
MQCKLRYFFTRTIYGSDRQCCGSGILSWIRLYSIPDPNCFHPGSWIPDPHKRLKYFNPKKRFLSSRKYDLNCLSRIRVLTFYPSRIPDPGVQKAPDPGSGSATLVIGQPRGSQRTEMSSLNNRTCQLVVEGVGEQILQNCQQPT